MPEGDDGRITPTDAMPTEPRPAVAGHVLVPREPTPEMVGAFWRVKNGHHFHDEPPPTDTSDYAAYRAMLAATPAPSPSEDVAEVVGRLTDPDYAGSMQHLRDWHALDRLHSDAAALILRLAGERDEARADRDDTRSRWLIRMYHIREASGVGAKPMLDEVADAIRERISALQAEVEGLRGALEPFAELYDGNDSDLTDGVDGVVTAAMYQSEIRRAFEAHAAALQKESGE